MSSDREKHVENATGEEFSLDAFRDAFAEMAGEIVPEEDAGADDGELGDSSEDEATRIITPVDEDPADISPTALLEAMLFVGHPDNRPLTADDAAALMRGVEPAEIQSLVDELNQRYTDDGRPYVIVAEGSGYRLTLRDSFADVREKFYGRVREARLSQQSIEVLSIVAYNQPISADRVNETRGKPSGAILTQLVRRQLLAMSRPDDKPKKPVYTTTDRFLAVFNLETLDDLPRSQDLQVR